MAQTFKAANGAKFSLIVNHLKSKGSCGGGPGTPTAATARAAGTPPASSRRSAWRHYFVPQVVIAPPATGRAAVGDFNSYGTKTRSTT
jgi:predicted extracellular nuclease